MRVLWHAAGNDVSELGVVPSLCGSREALHVVPPWKGGRRGLGGGGGGVPVAAANGEELATLARLLCQAWLGVFWEACHSHGRMGRS